ncbi:MAG TPA: hypothetical protein VGR73_02825 [Bryobacteraceae bacterium]|nr:hypothetical protein [Bryobacteraceae bacterium]
MIALASLVLPIGTGWVWCRAVGALLAERSWMARILHAGLAVALGFGASSALFFLLSWAGIASLPVIATSEITLLAAGAALMTRRREADLTAPQRLTYFDFMLLAALVALMCLAGAVAARTYAGAPHGRWDAWAIWNLRARYFAGEGTWRNAVSPLLAETHPDYPLATSSLIARTWLYGGREFDTAVPLAIAALYALATLLILVGAVGTIRGPTLGLLAGCVLLGVGNWVAEIGSQYADVPLSLYFVGAVSLLATAIATDRPRGAILAGALAGLGAFVKNEGLAFAAVVLIALALTAQGRRQWPAFAIGLAPALALVAAFKFFVAPSDPVLSQGSGLMLSKVADLSRWSAIASGFASRIWTLSDWYAHPLLLAGAVLFFFRPNRETRMQAMTLWIASALMLAAYLTAYVITLSDLKWQIDTSTDRLLVQILPAALVSVFIAAAPLAVQEMPTAPKLQASRKAGKKPVKAGRANR